MPDPTGHPTYDVHIRSSSGAAARAHFNFPIYAYTPSPISSHLFLLQATLEIEFFHQTLMRFCTPAAVKTLTEIYETISRAYQRKPGQTEDLQHELDGVKKTLNDTRRATQIEFLCFKSPKKDKGDGRKEREGTGERERDRVAGSRPPGDRRRPGP
jgi:exocyst complex component 2